MVNMIKKDAHLVPYLTTTIEDTGIEVGLDQRLCPDDFAAMPQLRLIIIMPG